MRIGLNAQILSRNDAGVATYARSLIRGLAHIDRRNDYYLFGNRGKLEGLVAENITIVPTGRQVQGRVARILWEQLVLPRKVRRRRIEVLHYPDHTASLAGRICPTVITIHDLSFLAHPGFFPRAMRTYKALSVRRSTAVADRVIVVSEATKRECMSLLGLAAERLRVVHNGVDPEFRPIEDRPQLETVRRQYRLPDKIILFVGTLEPRKNVVGLLHAFDRLRKRGKWRGKLVLVGGVGWLHQNIFDTIVSLGLSDLVRCAGYVPRRELPALYSQAELLVYPSFCEGFGLPVLEAMACGCPVIAANTSSFPEVVGDAGIMVDPNDIDALTGAMESVLGDEELRSGMRARGLKRAQAFSWDRCAQTTLAVYDEVCAS
jgi:glycosyltransferase involved in cell wall biosynthesis